MSRLPPTPSSLRAAPHAAGVPTSLGSYLVVSEAKTSDDVAIHPETLPEVKSEVPRTLTAPVSGGTALTAMFSSMKKEYRMTLGSSFQVSSGSTGVTNQLVSNDILSGLVEFVTLSSIFREFFINKFEVVYQPQSRYSKPVPTMTPSPNDVPLVIATLQHGSPAYASHSAACENASLFIANTADPWKVSWRNVEKKGAGVMPVAGTTTANPSQGWCLTDATNAALYTGALQIVSPAALPNLVLNYLYGTVVVRWDVSFRSRS